MPKLTTVGVALLRKRTPYCCLQQQLKVVVRWLLKKPTLTLQPRPSVPLYDILGPPPDVLQAFNDADEPPTLHEQLQRLLAARDWPRRLDEPATHGLERQRKCRLVLEAPLPFMRLRSIWSPRKSIYGPSGPKNPLLSTI